MGQFFSLQVNICNWVVFKIIFIELVATLFLCLAKCDMSPLGLYLGSWKCRFFEDLLRNSVFLNGSEALATLWWGVCPSWNQRMKSVLDEFYNVFFFFFFFFHVYSKLDLSFPNPCSTTSRLRSPVKRSVREDLGRVLLLLAQDSNPACMMGDIICSDKREREWVKVTHMHWTQVKIGQI